MERLTIKLEAGLFGIKRMMNYESFSLDQVKRGQAIIHQNLGALKELFGFLMDTSVSDVNDDPMNKEK
jgi:hypothetical protein